MEEDIETPVVDTIDNSFSQDQENSTIPPEELSKEERDWRAYREKRKEEQKLLLETQRQKKEAEEREAKKNLEISELKNAMSLLLEEKRKSSYEEEENPEDSQKKFISSEVQRLLNEEREAIRRKESQEQIKKDYAYIQQNMADLADVCNQDNVAYLEYFHPEIAIPLARMPDGLEKTEMLYKAIKKHVKMKEKDKEKLEQKLSRPKAAQSSVSNESTQERSSGVLSDQRKQEVWAKMNRLISGEDED